jgi:monoamine oxidase
VLTEDGEAAGDAAIVAVPLAVLRRLPFSPPVPGACQRAWQRAGLAHNAGEHSAGAWAGLMEGALRSGERAAREVLAGAG